MRGFFVALVLIGGAVYGFAHADESKRPQAKIVDEVMGFDSPAKILQRKSPTYPDRAWHKKIEGWVVVNFTVNPDGTTANIIVESSSHDKYFPKASVKAVKGWLFQPATLNGDPVAAHNFKTQINFQMDDKYWDDKRRFGNALKVIDRHLNRNELDKAWARMTTLRTEGKISLGDELFLNVREYRYYQSKNQLNDAWRAICRLESHGGFLSKKQYATLLAVRVALGTQLTRYDDVLRSYEQLEGLNHKGRLKELKPAIDQIRALQASAQPFSVPGSITRKCRCGGDNPFWQYRPLRRHIGFRDIQGKLGKLTIRCSHKILETQVDADWEYKMPDSWGVCDVFVHGDEGATFKLVEY